MGFRFANVDGRAALVSGEHYYDLETLSEGSVSSDPMLALTQTETLHKLAGQLDGQDPTGVLETAQLQSPSPRPRNSFGIGLNYRNHAEEAGMPIPETPMVFTKYTSCISPPNADVELRSDYVDFEGELVVVIGQPGKDIPVDEAWNHVAGLCIGQDISDRPAQFTSSPPHFNLGKSFDTFGPMGPVLVSPDLLPENANMELITRVNDEIRQQDKTGDLIFDVPALVSFLSYITSLTSGDVIFTGTPGGVGVVEGRFLNDGDIIETSIEGLGSMRNRCVRVSDHPRAHFVPEPMRKARAEAKG